MKKGYYAEINPIDKIEETVEIFREHAPNIFTKADEGYDWLEDDDARCIVFVNPYCDNNLEIQVEYGVEFTVCFAGSHSHYDAYQGQYEDMIESLKMFFANSLCVATLTDSNGKWFGDKWIEKTEITKDIPKIFNFVFKIKEFNNKLTASGYTATYTFWNPIDNKVVK